jgi:ATP adenylyltransferase
MERLFAPWRMGYVTGADKPSGCVLCAALEGAEADDSLVVHVSGHSFVVANLFPYTSGHVMVCPRRHLARLHDATDDELSDLMVLARRLEGVLGALYRPDGLNLGINLGQVAGAGVADHLHLHVVPRWTGDANFMTTVGGTRVIPEEPARVAARLRAGFRG